MLFIFIAGYLQLLPVFAAFAAAVVFWRVCRFYGRPSVSLSLLFYLVAAAEQVKHDEEQDHYGYDSEHKEPPADGGTVKREQYRYHAQRCARNIQ